MSAGAWTLLGVAVLLGGLFLFLDRYLVQQKRHWELDEQERRARRPGFGGVGNALMELHSLVNPGAREAVEEIRREQTEQDDEGDPPVK